MGAHINDMKLEDFIATKENGGISYRHKELACGAWLDDEKFANASDDEILLEIQNAIHRSMLSARKGK